MLRQLLSGQNTSRAAGRSIPGHGNIVHKKITNAISDAVDALATFLEFSQIGGIFLVDLENSEFSPRSISSEVRTFLEILTFSVKCSAK